MNNSAIKTFRLSDFLMSDLKPACGTMKSMISSHKVVGGLLIKPKCFVGMLHSTGQMALWKLGLKGEKERKLSL